MKKWIWVGTLTAVFATAAVYGMHTAQPVEAAATTDTVQKKTVIGFAKAKQNALAAVDGKGKVDSIELERENGALYYEVEIEQGRQDVDVRIDAYTGKTLDIRNDDGDDDRENNRSHTSQSTGTGQSSQSADSSKTKITAEKAVAAAKSYMNGTLKEVDLDKDDGRWIYEVELNVAGGKVEIEVDAYTAEIISVDHDDDN